MIQDVFIIGATGNVGSTLVRQIVDRKDTDPGLHKNPTRIVGLASKESCIYRPEGIGANDALAFAGRKLSGERPASPEGMLSMVSGHGSADSRLVFVDATSLKGEMMAFHKKIIRETLFGIVTANKNPLALSGFGTFQSLVREVPRYGFRCSVMAGAEAVNFMLDIRDLNDPLVKIEGCFSGTLGYICTGLQEGKKLSEIVRQAASKGYTEPNPADDLSGEDVAKKILILVRSAGLKADFGDLLVEPFVPEKILAAKSREGLFSGLEAADAEFSRRALEAKMKGNVLRYVACAENTAGGKVSLSVGLREVPQKSPLGSLLGTTNKIVVTTGTYTDEKPYVVEAPGAGPEITAQNIRRDLLAQLSGRLVAPSGL